MLGYKHILKEKDYVYIRKIGDTKFEKVLFNNYYYAPTKEETGIRDIFGNNLKKCAYNEKMIKMLKDNGTRLSESELDIATKYLHECYDAVVLNAQTKDFRICLYDIETQTGRKYPLDHNIKIKITENDNTTEKTISIRNFEDNYDYTNADIKIYDEETNEWKGYTSSCYLTTEFPDPKNADYPINLITCLSNIDNKLYTWGLEPYTDTSEPIDNYFYFEDELDMLKDWIKWFNKQYFDIFSGYNSDIFDLPYIINRIRKLCDDRGIATDYTAKLSPLGKVARAKVKTEMKTGVPIGETIDIPGMITIDFLDAFKKFGGYSNLPTWKLDYVAELVCGDHKTEYEGSIRDIYRKDWNLYTRYNRQDVALLGKINDKKHIFDMIISFANDCLIPLPKVFSMLSTVQGYILKFIHNNNMKLPDSINIDKNNPSNDWWHSEGYYKVKNKDGSIYYQNVDFEKNEVSFPPFHVKAGYVYACPGRYDWVLSGDITSSYPHQMMMYNISPETKVIKPSKEQIENEHLIESEINGVYYKRTEGAVLPTVVRKVFDEKDYYSKLKKKALADGNKELAQIYENQRSNKKIIANSMYGVLLNEHFAFYDVDNARAITRAARNCIRYIQKCTDMYYVSKQFLKDAVKYIPNCPPDITTHEPLQTVGRKGCVVQVDTDSNYCCFQEYRKLFPNTSDTEFAYGLEKQMNDFWNMILDIKAKKKDLKQLIIFNRENIFTHFFSFAKKMYMGDVVDSEGDKHWDSPKPKIQGLVLKRTEIPQFCQERATKLCFDIMRGMSKEEAIETIQQDYIDFKKQDITNISANRGVHEYNKYLNIKVNGYKMDMNYYINNGLNYANSIPFNVKSAINWNYVVSKLKLPLELIGQGSKFKYVYLKPNNKYRIDQIGWLKWTKQFDDLFEIDYDTCFDKFYMPCIKSMFEVLEWKKPKENINIKKSKANKFLK